MRGRRLGVAGSGIGKVAGEVRAAVRRWGVPWALDGAQARSGAAGTVGAGPGAGLEPVTFERLPGEARRVSACRGPGGRRPLGGDPWGRPCAVMPLEPNARRFRPDLGRREVKLRV